MLELIDLKCLLANNLLQLLHFAHVEARGHKEVPKAFGCMLLQGVFAHALHPLSVLEGLKDSLEKDRQVNSRRRAMITSRGALPPTFVYHNVVRRRGTWGVFHEVKGVPLKQLGF